MLTQRANAPPPGGALVLSPSSKAPQGVLGIVTSRRRLPNGSVRVTTKPGTLDGAFKSFDIRLDTTLGEAKAGGPFEKGAAGASASLGHFAPSFTCHGAALRHPITTHVDLSDLHLVFEVTSQPSIEFLLTGSPRFDLGVAFTGSVTCTAEAQIPIPIADTGIVVEIGPKFTFSAHGEVGADFVWTPHVTLGYIRSRYSGSTDAHVFRSAGSVKFSGGASVDLNLGLETDVSLAGRVGVSGTIGPDVTASVETDVTKRSACFTAYGSIKAELNAFANVLFKDWTFSIFRGSFGRTQLYRACSGGDSQGGGPHSPEPGPPGSGPPLTGAVSLAVGSEHACAVLSGGSIACWGDGQEGQLGDGSRTLAASRPVRVAGISDATSVAAGFSHTCALLTSGTVECWGGNESGQLGDGSATDSTTPVPVEGITQATAIASSNASTCALLATGEVACWGRNEWGELGYGTWTGPEKCPSSVPLTDEWNCSTHPVKVSGITDAIAIAVGSYSACAVIEGGGLECWGRNDTGTLGDGTDTGPEKCGIDSIACSAAPVSVSGISSAVRVTVGGGHACTILSSGGVKCWGWNLNGQLGDGTTLLRSTPVSTVEIVDGAEIAAGWDHTCATLSTGRVWCWGDNASGELGLGTSASPQACFEKTPCSSAPLPVSAISDGVAVGSGYESSCAMLTGGRIACWGDNVNGQLGDGTSGGPELCSSGGGHACSTEPVLVTAPR